MKFLHKYVHRNYSVTVKTKLVKYHAFLENHLEIETRSNIIVCYVKYFILLKKITIKIMIENNYFPQNVLCPYRNMLVHTVTISQNV